MIIIITWIGVFDVSCQSRTFFVTSFAYVFCYHDNKMTLKLNYFLYTFCLPVL